MEHTEENTEKILNNFKWDDRHISAFKRLEQRNSLLKNIKDFTLLSFLITYLFFWYKKPYKALDDETYDFHKSWLYYSIVISFILVHIISWGLHKVISKDILSTYKWNAVNKNSIRKRIIVFKDFFSSEFNGLDFEYMQLKEKTNSLTSFNDTLKLSKSGLELLLKFIFTPDYFWAEFHKRKIGLYVSPGNTLCLKELELTRYFKKFYLERSNWANLIITIILVPLIMFFLADKPLLQGKIPYFILIFVSYRTLSRTLEILIAFYNDIVVKKDKIFYKKDDGFIFTINNDIKVPFKYKDVTLNNINRAKPMYIYPWKSSLLLPSSRTSLAIHSLVELTIIFGCLYFLMAGLNHYITNVKDAVPEDLLKENNTGIVKYFLYSFSIAITLPDIKPATYWAIPQFFQILSSLVLVIMSVAYYLGAEHKLQERERELYQALKEDYNKNKFNKS